jgi:hypothetical protein
MSQKVIATASKDILKWNKTLNGTQLIILCLILYSLST